MTTSQKAAQDILQIFKSAKSGVSYINPILFVGLAPDELEAIKARVRGVLARYRC